MSAVKEHASWMSTRFLCIIRQREKESRPVGAPLFRLAASRSSSRHTRVTIGGSILSRTGRDDGSCFSAILSQRHEHVFYSTERPSPNCTTSAIWAGRPALSKKKKTVNTSCTSQTGLFEDFKSQKATFACQNVITAIENSVDRIKNAHRRTSLSKNLRQG